MHKLSILILLLFLLVGCSSGDDIEIPGHLQDLENLTVYPADAQPAHEIRFEREQRFGSTDEVVIRAPVLWARR